MTVPNFPRIDRALRVIGDSHLKESLAVIIGLGIFGYGLTLIFAPGAVLATRTYAVAMTWAAPQLWGVVMSVLAVTLGLTMWANRQQGMWPALGLTLVFLAMTIANVLAVPNGGIPVTIWLNLMVSMACGLLTAACAVVREPIPT